MRAAVSLVVLVLAIAASASAAGLRSISLAEGCRGAAAVVATWPRDNARIDGASVRTCRRRDRYRLVADIAVLWRGGEVCRERDVVTRAAAGDYRLRRSGLVRCTRPAAQAP